MTDTSVGNELRRLRGMAGLSQRQLSQRVGLPQPNIAAYETGRRSPTTETLDRLTAALTVPTLDRVRRVREEILRSAASRNLTNVRVFGSVARGHAGSASDVDLLVHPAPDASIFDLAGFMAEVEDILGAAVDVVSDRGTGPTMDRIRTEAVAL